MAHTATKIRPDKKQVLILVLAVLTLYVIVPQLGGFRHSIALLPKARQVDLAAAAIFASLTYAAAAGTYCLLAMQRLSYRRTVWVQVAGMFVNRLLPAGIGGIGVNYAYLRKSQHTPSQAASVVAANNGLGIIGHSLLLSGLLLAFHDTLPGLHLWHTSRLSLLVAISVIAIVAWLVFFQRFRNRLLYSLQGFFQQLLEYRHRPLRLTAALVCSISLTLCNVLSLWFCVLAMHIGLPFTSVLLVFTFGIALGTATPTPGGLGGIEAGLIAGLVAYHASSAAALAAVLAYRLISYWLALVIGALAFAFSQKRGYL